MMLQCSCIFMRVPDVQFIYQLGHRAAYVGRGALCRPSANIPGGLLRFREHFRALFPHDTVIVISRLLILPCLATPFSANTMV